MTFSSSFLPGSGANVCCRSGLTGWNARNASSMPSIAEVADRYHDDLAPAIERVWLDGIAAIGADLREWLRRASLDDSGFVPRHFELSFGLEMRRSCTSGRSAICAGAGRSRLRHPAARLH